MTESSDLDLGLPGDAQALLEAVLAISSDLDLHSVLKRIVESACRITHARYGALGVLDSHSTGLSDFVTFGMTDGGAPRHRRPSPRPRDPGAPDRTA